MKPLTSSKGNSQEPKESEQHSVPSISRPQHQARHLGLRADGQDSPRPPRLLAAEPRSDHPGRPPKLIFRHQPLLQVLGFAKSRNKFDTSTAGVSPATQGS
jgi:hypothetical protein